MVVRTALVVTVEAEVGSKDKYAVSASKVHSASSSHTSAEKPTSTYVVTRTEHEQLENVKSLASTIAGHGKTGGRSLVARSPLLKISPYSTGITVNALTVCYALNPRLTIEATESAGTT